MLGRKGAKRRTVKVSKKKAVPRKSRKEAASKKRPTKTAPRKRQEKASRRMKKNKEPVGMQPMFRQPQGHLFEASLEEDRQMRSNVSVECLGTTFPNDDARRAFFLEKLEEKLKDPEFR